MRRGGACAFHEVRKCVCGVTLCPGNPWQSRLHTWNLLVEHWTRNTKLKIGAFNLSVNVLDCLSHVCFVRLNFRLHLSANLKFGGSNFRQRSLVWSWRRTAGQSGVFPRGCLERWMCMVLTETFDDFMGITLTMCITNWYPRDLLFGNPVTHSYETNGHKCSCEKILMRLNNRFYMCLSLQPAGCWRRMLLLSSPQNFIPRGVKL